MNEVIIPTNVATCSRIRVHMNSDCTTLLRKGHCYVRQLCTELSKSPILYIVVIASVVLLIVLSLLSVLADLMQCESCAVYSWVF